MVSVPVVKPPEKPAPTTKLSWTAMAWFGGLLILCYAPILYRLVSEWTHNQDMGYGFFVPIVAAYIAWRRRHVLLAAPRQSNGWGLVIVIYAACEALAATIGAELFTQRLAFVIALFGVVLYLGGTRWVKILLFPLLLLLFMIPIPEIIYATLTLKLQMIASSLGEMLITAVGIPVFRTGNVLHLPSQNLDVAEACSGIRSLLALGFLSLVYAYFADRRVWMRWALLIATIPIAIVANGIRVAFSGVLSQVNTKYAQGAYHELEGYIVFIVALIALLITHRVLRAIAAKGGGVQTKMENA
ncbi:MAG: exosortase/archaeosortase family protein [Bryobacteraceae bacterium]